MSYRGMKLAAGVIGTIGALEYSGFGPFSRSSGVQNIEKSWSRGGGSTVHTPAIASKLGDSDNVVGDHGHVGGFGSPSRSKQISESRRGSDNVTVARTRPSDKDAPGAEQKSGKPA